MFGDDSVYHTTHEYTGTVNVVMTRGHTNPGVIAQQLQEVSAAIKDFDECTIEVTFAHIQPH